MKVLIVEDFNKTALFSDIEMKIKSKNYIEVLNLCLENISIDNEKISYYLALIYFRLKKYDLAERSILAIQSNLIKNNKYYFLKGQIYEKLKNIEEAENGFFVAVRKVPKNKRYLKKYISFSKAHNNYELAIEKLKVVSKNKKDKNFYLRLEFVKFNILKGRLKEAFLELKELEEKMDADHDEINLQYSIIYESIGDYANALSALEKVSLVNVDNIFRKNDLRLTLGSQRENVVEDLYNFMLINKNKNLTIILSPVENKYILKGYDFNTSVLYVSEKVCSYYIYDYLNLVDYLANIIKLNNFDNINLVGSSKGGFAAINISIYLSNLLKNKKIKVIPFSPQSYIYPLNNNISGLPSYKDIWKKSENSISFYNDLVEFGNPLNRMNSLNPNVEIDIIYGGNHERDKKEAEAFKGYDNVNLQPILGYPFHTSIMLYTKKGEALLKGISNRAIAAHKDDLFFEVKSHDVLVEQILKEVDNYNYDLNPILLNNFN